MKKSTLKIFALLFGIILLPIIGLIEFQKHTQKQMMQNFPPPFPSRFESPIPNAPPQRKEPNSTIPYIVIFAISAILCSFFIKYISKNYIIPLETISENLKKIKKDDLNIYLETKNQNQAITQLFNTLNSVIESLKEKKQLQESFIRSLTHDLRAPALAQDRMLSILENEFEDNELIGYAKRKNEDYIKLINLIIESYTNIEITIKKEKQQISNIVKNIVKTLEPLALEKNIRIINNVSDKFTCYVDFVAINRILLNLISNSLEVIPNEKQITISAKSNLKNDIIIIEDNGCGIAPEFLPLIFEKKASLNKTGQKAVSGLGLGICKNLVEKNNGSIEVKSEVGKYTKFILMFEKE